MTILEPKVETLARTFARYGSEIRQVLSLNGYNFESQRRCRDTGDDLGDWWHAFLSGEVQTSLNPSNETVRVVDLFCGSGGLGLGFAEACRDLGLVCRSELAVDQDAEAVRVYTANHGTRRRITESVSSLIDYFVLGQGPDASFAYQPELLSADTFDLIGNVDVVLAGPPCQGHSNLNNKTRRSDKRNELYLTVPAMAVALKAKTVIIENVPAVIHDAQQVVQTSKQLLQDAGYKVTTGILAASRMGWPQTRQRYFMVASLEHEPISLEVVAKSLEAPDRSVTWAIEDLVDDPDANLGIPEPEYSEENWRRINWLFDNNAYDLALSERPDCHKAGTTYNAVYGRMHPDKPAPTMTTGFLTPGRGRFIHPTERRVLRPREAARVQGFPDTYIFKPDPLMGLTKQKISKWIGDAVPMPLGYGASLSALMPGLGS